MYQKKLLKGLSALLLTAFSITATAQPAEKARAADESWVGAKRVALVIGNAAYKYAPLKNPLNDAIAMDGELKKLGFATRLVKDSGWQNLNETMRDFLQQTKDAEARVVFYAGHGAQIRGKNYLMPVDLKYDSEEDLVQHSVNVSEVLDRLGRSSKGLNVVILDACRNNPMSNVALTADGRKIKIRGATPGLATVQTPPGTLLAFSTSPGNVADDLAGGENSLYTKHLLRHISEPGVPLEQMFKRVRIDVLQESQQKQTPWEQGNLTVDYCLKLSANGKCAGL
jgi:carboxyl-terminal processing protease